MYISNPLTFSSNMASNIFTKKLATIRTLFNRYWQNKYNSTNWRSLTNPYPRWRSIKIDQLSNFDWLPPWIGLAYTSVHFCFLLLYGLKNGVIVERSVGPIWKFYLYPLLRPLICAILILSKPRNKGVNVYDSWVIPHTPIFGTN